jgi:hypothetical protein
LRETTKEQGRKTYAGQPKTIAATARIVSPFPNPSVLYIAGANKGNPKPASDLKKATAAIAECERFEESYTGTKLYRTGSGMKRKAFKDVGLDTLKAHNNACSYKRHTLLKPSAEK